MTRTKKPSPLVGEGDGDSRQKGQVGEETQRRERKTVSL